MVLTAAAALLPMHGSYDRCLEHQFEFCSPPVAVFQLFQSPRWALA